MNANTLPSTLDFFVSTPIGVSSIVFVISMIVLLVLQPPSVKIVAVEGTSLSWFRVIVFSFVIAASVQIYPLFLMAATATPGGAATMTVPSATIGV